MAADPQVREAYLGENFVYQDILNKPNKKHFVYNIWAGNFDSKSKFQHFVDVHFSEVENLRLMYGFDEIGFASLANSEIGDIFTNVVDLQKSALNGIVTARTSVSTELRKFLAGETASSETVQTLSEQYGNYEGEMIYYYATYFSQVYQSIPLYMEIVFCRSRVNYQYLLFPRYTSQTVGSKLH